MKHSLVVISILSILALLASAFAAPHPMTGKIRPGEPHPFYCPEPGKLVQLTSISRLGVGLTLN